MKLIAIGVAVFALGLLILSDALATPGVQSGQSIFSGMLNGVGIVLIIEGIKSRRR